MQDMHLCCPPNFSLVTPPLFSF